MSDPADRLAELRNTLAVYEREYQEKTIKLMSHYSENNNNNNNNPSRDIIVNIQTDKQNSFATIPPKIEEQR